MRTIILVNISHYEKGYILIVTITSLEHYSKNTMYHYDNFRLQGVQVLLRATEM